MIPIINLVKHATFLGLLVFLMTLWFGAPLLEINGIAPFVTVQARLVLCLIILFALGLVVFIERLRTGQKTIAQDPKQADEKRDFKLQVHEYLKKIYSLFRLARLDALRLVFRSPWVLIVGAKGSGKTKFLQSSQLIWLTNPNSPSAQMASASFSSNYNLHLSNQAVFVEATSTLKEGDANLFSLWDPAWKAILKFLKCFRLFWPIQAVIITIALPDLFLEAVESRSGAKQQQLVNDIAQLISLQLSRDFPIYIIFTQCDRLAGFREYFASLNNQDLDETWGIYFSKDQYKDKEEFINFFELAFSQFISQLNQSLIANLANEKNIEIRKLLSYFPHQIELFKSKLRALLPTEYYRQLRGLFFISSTQSAETTDFVMSAFASKFPNKNPITQPIIQEKVYFVKRILTHAILPAIPRFKNQLSGLEQLKFFKEKIGYLSAITVLVLGFALWGSYCQNNIKLKEIQYYLNEYQQKLDSISGKNNSLTSLITLLDSAKKIEQVYPLASEKLILYFIGYQPHQIKNHTNAALQRIVNNMILPSIAQHFEQMLSTVKDTELLYSGLKGYLAFSGLPQVNPNWIPAALRLEIGSSEASKLDLPRTILPHLRDIAAGKIHPLKLDQNLIQRTRSYLQTIPLQELTYYELRQIVQDVLPNSVSEHKTEEVLAQSFNISDSKYSIPAIYTYRGYKALRDNSKKLLQKSSLLYWILGLPNTSYKPLVEGKLTPNFWSKYSRDYIQHWENYLANVHLHPTDDPQEFIQLLNKLTSRNSTLKMMLQFVEDQTTRLQDSQVFVSQHFRSLHELNTTASKKRQSISYGIVDVQLNKLKAYMIQISEAQDFEQSAFDAAKAYLKGQDTPIRQLKNLAALAPDPLRHWLEDIVNNAMGVLLRGARPVINNAWETNVVPIFNAELKNRFPFTSTSQSIVSLSSIGEFFGENGVIDNFLHTYLKPFIDIGQNSWRLYQFGQFTLGIQPENLRMLEKSAIVRRLYFSHGGKQPSVQFAIKPRHLCNTSSDIYLQYGSQSLSYQHGPQQLSNWTWPSTGSQQVNVIINDFNGGAYSRSYDGEWALFKLFTGAKISAAGSGHYIWTINDGPYQASFELWTNKSPFLFDLDLFKAIQLPERL